MLGIRETTKQQTALLAKANGLAYDPCDITRESRSDEDRKAIGKKDDETTIKVFVGLGLVVALILTFSL